MTKKKYIRRSFAVLSLLYLAVFASFYIIRYLPSVNLLDVSDTVYYIVFYITSALEYCLPLLSAATVFALSGFVIKNALLYCLILAIPRFFYLLPYYYLYAIAYGNDSIESLSFSFCVTLGLILALAVYIFILYIVIYFISRALIIRRLKSELPIYKQKNLTDNDKAELKLRLTEELDSEMPLQKILDISNPVSAAILCAAALEFVYLFIRELIGAVDYLTDYAGTYTGGEIFYMVFSFTFILFKALLSYSVAVRANTLAHSKTFGYVEEDEEEEENENCAEE